MTTKEKLTAFRKPKVKAVEVEGETLHVRSLTGRERDAYEAEQHDLNQQGKTLDNFRARLVARCLCESDGTAIDVTPEDVGDLDAGIVGKLFDAAASLNGLAFGADADAAQKK